MKYYSSETKKFYETERECLEAERALAEERKAAQMAKEKVAAERKTRAAEVEEARKAMVEAQKKYQELLEAFIKDFKSYHLSLSGEDAKNAAPTLFDIFNPFFINF